MMMGIGVTHVLEYSSTVRCVGASVFATQFTVDRASKCDSCASAAVGTSLLAARVCSSPPLALIPTTAALAPLAFRVTDTVTATATGKRL